MCDQKVCFCQDVFELHLHLVAECRMGDSGGENPIQPKKNQSVFLLLQIVQENHTDALAS